MQRKQRCSDNAAATVYLLNAYKTDGNVHAYAHPTPPPVTDTDCDRRKTLACLTLANLDTSSRFERNACAICE